MLQTLPLNTIYTGPSRTSWILMIKYISAIKPMVDAGSNPSVNSMNKISVRKNSMRNSGSRSAKTRDGRLVNFQVFDWSFNTNLKLLLDEMTF